MPGDPRKSHLEIIVGPSSRKATITTYLYEIFNKLITNGLDVRSGILTYGAGIYRVVRIGEIRDRDDMLASIRNINIRQTGSNYIDALSQAKQSLVDLTQHEIKSIIWMIISDHLTNLSSFKEKYRELQKYGIDMFLLVTRNIDRKIYENIIGKTKVLVMGEKLPYVGDISVIDRAMRKGKIFMNTEIA